MPKLVASLSFIHTFFAVFRYFFQNFPLGAPALLWELCQIM